MIKIKNLSKTYNGVQVLQHVSLEIIEGEMLVLLGPSGCGKTTLLRLIAGFEIPDKGEISIDSFLASTSEKTIPPYKRNLAMIFQDLALWPHMKVRENIQFVLKGLKTKKGRLAEETASVLKLVGLDNHLERYPAQLSGGEQQRLAIARALSQRPKNLLLDEPLSSLDPHLKKELQALLKELQGKLKITMVYVTHDQREALSLGGKVAVMQKGKIEQVGRLDELIKNPKNEFVYSFLKETKDETVQRPLS